MKKLVFTLAIAAFGTFAVQAQAPAAATPTHAAMADKKAPRFQFVGGEVHDFGALAEGPDAEYIFKFKNVGKQPLIITNASASCGCTVPAWPKEPILPGKMGEVKVTFHTSGKGGQPFDKTVYIMSNAASDKDRYELHIKGSVNQKTDVTAPAKG